MEFTHNDIHYLIRHIEPDDAAKVSSERNNDRLFLHDCTLVSVSKTRRWIENLPQTSQRLIVEEVGQGKNLIVGCFRIDGLDLINSTCYVGLDLYKKGEGLSRPVYRAALNYLFNNLNLYMVYLEVIESNTRAEELYRKIGFIKCGELPERILREGRRHNSNIYYFSSVKFVYDRPNDFKL